MKSVLYEIRSLPILASDVGKALIAGGISLSLYALPLPFENDNIEEIKELLSEELSVMALDEATIPLEKAAGLFLPVFKNAITPLLTVANPKQLKSQN